MPLQPRSRRRNGGNSRRKRTEMKRRRGDEGSCPPSGRANGTNRTAVLPPPGAGNQGVVTEPSSGLPPDCSRRYGRLKMRSFREGVRAFEHPSHQAGRLPQGPRQRYGGPHSLCCSMTTGSSGPLGESGERRPSHAGVGPQRPRCLSPGTPDSPPPCSC